MVRRRRRGISRDYPPESFVLAGFVLVDRNVAQQPPRFSVHQLARRGRNARAQELSADEWEAVGERLGGQCQQWVGAAEACNWLGVLRSVSRAAREGVERPLVDDARLREELAERGELEALRLAEMPVEPTELTWDTTTLALLQALALKVDALSTRLDEHDNNKNKEQRDIPSDDAEVSEGGKEPDLDARTAATTGGRAALRPC
eukprot:jgi/Tetstr1/461626/TSEL_006726.t1